MGQRTKADGRLQIPPHWPKWKMKCTAHRKHTNKTLPCRNWAVTGMPTCKYHGSGGEANRELGQIRYLAWIIVGGPQCDRMLPAEAWARVAIATIYHMMFEQGVGSVDQQLKAAMWLSNQTED